MDVRLRDCDGQAELVREHREDLARLDAARVPKDARRERERERAVRDCRLERSTQILLDFLLARLLRRHARDEDLRRCRKCVKCLLRLCRSLIPALERHAHAVMRGVGLRHERDMLAAYGTQREHAHARRQLGRETIEDLRLCERLREREIHILRLARDADRERGAECELHVGIES